MCTFTTKNIYEIHTFVGYFIRMGHYSPIINKLTISTTRTTYNNETALITPSKFCIISNKESFQQE